MSVRAKTGREERGLTAPGKRFVDDLVQGLRDACEAFHLVPLLRQRVHEPSVVVAHLRELRSDFAGELDAVLDGGIGLQRLALDLLEEIWPSAKELVMRELPSLHVRRSALGAGRLFGISSQYVNED